MAGKHYVKMTHYIGEGNETTGVSNYVSILPESPEWIPVSGKGAYFKIIGLYAPLAVSAGSENMDAIYISQDVVNGGSVLLKVASSGFGIAQIGNNQEWGFFGWTEAGAVTLMAQSANTVNSDTASKFCIYDAGTGVAIKNNLGSTLALKVWEINS
jgi:hypothetical protein